MRRLSLLAVAVLLIAGSAHAITYGFVDQTKQYANVGAFLVKSPSGNIYQLCSGTLITPTVFLTASHCTEYFSDVLAAEGFTAFVSFDSPIPFGSQTSSKTNVIPVATVVTNPLYNKSQSDSEDIGVLILAQAQKKIAPAMLISCGYLDRQSAQNGLKDAVFTAVGYGVQNRVNGGGQPFFTDTNPVPRMFAFSSFNSLNGGYIRLSQNPSTGNGGTCYGDSGGPNFLDINGQSVLAAITITGDTACRSTNVDYRLDTPQVQAFFSWVNRTYGTSIPLSSC